VDPVELVRGKQVDGQESLSATHGPYSYLFTNAENLAAFQKDPTRYEIQLGGACARMGPLSGEGRCDIFTVHDGRVYIFASPQCRDGFLKAPEKMLESDDPPATGDAAAKRRGAELIDLAVKAAGGAAKLDGVRTYRQRRETQPESGGQKHTSNTTVCLAFPDRARYESTWDAKWWGHAVNGTRGFFATHDGFDRDMAASQVRAFQRENARLVITILKSRNQADFVAAALAQSSLDGQPVERVAVTVQGATTTLGIDPKSGRVLSAAYPARGGPRGVIGKLELEFVDWHTVDGVTLPVAWLSRFGGQPQGDEPTRLTAFEIDPALDEGIFAPPVAK
jgi:YHS domain-containing protein